MFKIDDEVARTLACEEDMCLDCAGSGIDSDTGQDCETCSGVGWFGDDERECE